MVLKVVQIIGLINTHTLEPFERFLNKSGDAEVIEREAWEVKSQDLVEMVAQASFITSLVTSFVVFCILILAYCILSRRPENAVVYYPLRVLRGEDGAALAKRRGPLAWIVESFKATDDDIVAAAGLDAAVYMHLFTAGMDRPCLVVLTTSISIIES